MANINIELPDDLHKELRLLAVKKDTSLKGLVIAILEGKAR